MKNVYADYNGTSPATHTHLKELFSLFDGKLLGNASSAHQCGREMRKLRESTRETISKVFGLNQTDNIFFTSGATESNNTIIQGLKASGDFIFTAGEHASVCKPIQFRTQTRNEKAIRIPLQTNGLINRDELIQAVHPDTAFITFMHVNNETGCINPVEDLANEVRKKAPSAHIHVDMVQSWGKLDLSFVANSQIDSAAISGHKVGGISGAGALFLRNPNKVQPLILGGGHEQGFRAGTESMVAITSMGLRAQYIAANPDWLSHTKTIRADLAKQFEELGFKIWGSGPNVGNTLRLTVPGKNIDELMLTLVTEKISVSSGSACSSGNPLPSHTLLSMGATDWEAAHSLRISFGDQSSSTDAQRIYDVLSKLK